MSQEKYPSLTEAIDLSHHLSDLAKARVESPFHALAKYEQNPKMISMTSGMPDPLLIPTERILVDALLPTAFAKKNSESSSLFEWIWGIFRAPPKTETYILNKFAPNSEGIDLATALQYCSSSISGPQGIIQLQDFIREFTGKVFSPAYNDWRTLAHCGNTDGINRCFYAFLNPGDSLLVEEWTYPAAMSTAMPLGVKFVPLKMDGQGISAVDLERVLSTWDEGTQGRRPHVMYTVPVGQNPTGATMGLERKQAIYDICVDYDIIIVEDDSYFFLQHGSYIPKAQRAKTQRLSDNDPTAFISSLTPTFLKCDYQGRVIRLDSFSKIIAPGSRMGWMTCNPLFAERLEFHAETSTDAPSGFSQAIIIQLITKHWGMDKFFRWLQGIQGEYTARRDFLVDTLSELFDVVPATGEMSIYGAGSPVLTAYLKESTSNNASPSETYKAVDTKIPLFSFIPPNAGMFVWLKFHVGKIVVLKPGETLAMHIFIDLVKEGLLIWPGTIFSADGSMLPHGEAPFRIAFGSGTQETMLQGLRILEKVMKTYCTI